MMKEKITTHECGEGVSAEGVDFFEQQFGKGIFYEDTEGIMMGKGKIDRYFIISHVHIGDNESGDIVEMGYDCIYYCPWCGKKLMN